MVLIKHTSRSFVCVYGSFIPCHVAAVYGRLSTIDVIVINGLEVFVYTIGILDNRCRSLIQSQNILFVVRIYNYERKVFTYFVRVLRSMIEAVVV